MADLRHCRWCRHPIAFGHLNSQRIRPAHCPNPACDWCLPCVHRREALGHLGYTDMLEPVEPETAAEQTQELPPVRDGEPPIDPNDQMT